ncbi:MAG: PaaI family thioesterase [Bryobacteraceae bacterium]
MPLAIAALRKIMQRAPFNNLLGIRLKRRHADGVTIECPIRPDSANLAGTLHGGITATLADVAGGFAALAHYGDRPLTTVELKLNYFLPVTGSRVTARSHVLRAGRTLCVSQVEIRNEQRKLAAVAIVTYMLLDR